MLSKEALEARRAGIGGSDAANIIGVEGAFGSALQVYKDKVSDDNEPEIKNESALYWGSKLEDLVADSYTEKTGEVVRRVNDMRHHRDYPFIIAHLDRKVQGKKKVLECKTANAFLKDKWGESGTDIVPEPYLVQITHYMNVMGWNEADIAVLIGGQDFRIYSFERDTELAEMILSQEIDFWKNHVEPRIPPPPSCQADLSTWFAIDNGESVIADEEVEKEATELKELKVKLKAMEAEKKQKEEKIKIYMGENSVLLGSHGGPVATYKKAKDSEKLNRNRLRDEHPKLYDDFCETVAGSRRFLIK